MRAKTRANDPGKGNNIVDSVRPFREPFRKARPKRKGNPVTIIIGLICRNSIILAADSQTSYGDSKLPNARKICTLTFAGEASKSLIAQAGTAETSSAVIANAAKLAALRKLGNEDTVREVVQSAIQQERDRLRQHHFNCSAEEFRKIIFDEGLDCLLMTACYGERSEGPHVPIIDVFDFGSGLVRRQMQWYQAIGIGEVLANYLLQEISATDMDDKLGVAVAVYVVDRVIQHVRDCGEPIQMAVIRPWVPLPGVVDIETGQEIPFPYPDYPEKVHLVAQPEIEKIKESVRAIDRETRRGRLNDFRAALAEYAATSSDLSKAVDRMDAKPPAGVCATSLTRDWVIQHLTGEPPKH